MKIDYKKLFNMFKDKYDEISHFNKHDYEIYKEYLYRFDKLIDDEIEFAKLAHKFEDSVNDAFSDRYCLALMFALEELGLLDAIESGRIEEKSLKEDSLDDIISVGHSEYFDTLIEFLKDNDVPFRISHTVDGGKICYVENDIDYISVIFKSPKRGYELLKMIELWNDGSVYLSRKMGSSWFFKHVPLNEVYIWDMDKDEFVNYKGKVLKNITYDDIVESKESVRKSIKESINYEVEGLYFFNFDVGEKCSVDLKDAFNADGVISEFYKNENRIYSIVVCPAIEHYFFISYDYRKKKVIHSECFSSYQNAKNTMRDWLKNI